MEALKEGFRCKGGGKGRTEESGRERREIKYQVHKKKCATNMFRKAEGGTPTLSVYL